MEQENMQLQEALSPDESAVWALYHAVLDGWNKHDAAAFAAPFAEGGAVIGFDGSQYANRAETQENLQHIFADHLTGSYVSKIRSVSFLASDVALLLSCCAPLQV